MATLQLEIDDEMLAKLQRLAAQEGTSIEMVATQELGKALNRQPRYLEHSPVDVFSNSTYRMRTFLSGVIGFSELLLKDVHGELNDEVRHDVAMINRSGVNLLEVLNHFVDLIKIEQGKTIIHFIDTDLLSLLHDLAGKLDIQLKLLSSLPELPFDGVVVTI